ncbi:MAG: alpha/beta hydrolase [Phycisphaerae bacterium]|nr:alpha/beta hydrolase [Phycisphaerae bacterium]
MIRTRLLEVVRTAFALFPILIPFTAAAGVHGDSPSSMPTPSSCVWQGKIMVSGTVLDFVVRFGGDEESPTGTIDIPAQGAKGLPLREITLGPERMKFTLAVGSTTAEFDLDVDPDGKSAEGTMTQFGQKFIVTAERITESEAREVGPRRPQTPKPPFPYEAEEVTFKNSKDGITLAGTLTRPTGQGPFPAVVLISGSGAQDRDETLLGHKPFLVLADHLTREGIAVLRFDDRGVGGSTAPLDVLRRSTTADLANDARAALNFLRTRKDINPKHIGLIGHSEGGVIAPMIAAEDRDVAAVIMLAGSGVPGRKVLSGQLERIARVSGVYRHNVDRQLEAQSRFFDALLNDSSEEKLRETLRELVKIQYEPAGKPMDGKELDAAVELAMKSSASPWMRYFIAHDPREALRRVKCPVLAINGTLDLQVLCDDNLPGIEKALHDAGNKDVTILRLEGLNHLFQHSGTGLPTEYSFIEETFAPEALSAVSQWLNKRFAPADGPGKTPEARK